jgi:hypothetical protein
VKLRHAIERKLLLASDQSVGVEHDSDVTTHSSGRKILSERSSDSAIVAVGSNDGAPHDSVFGVVSHVLCLENVSDSLAIVKACVFPVLETFDFEECLLLILGGLTSSEASEDSLDIQSTENS